jgi:hypothetical protein
MEQKLHAQMLAALIEQVESNRFDCWLNVLTLRWRPEGFRIGTVSKLADRIWSERRFRSLPTAIDLVAASMPPHRYGAGSADLYGLAVVCGRPLPWTWSGSGTWSRRAVAAVGDDVQYRLGWRMDVPAPFATIVEPAAVGRWWPNQWWWARTGSATARLLESINAGGER